MSAVKYLTALRSNPTAALPGLSYIGSFSLNYSSTQILVAAPDGNALEARLVFTLAFAAPPSTASVQAAMQTAVASVNASVKVTTSAVSVDSKVYNVTVTYPPNDQVHVHRQFGIRYQNPASYLGVHQLAVTM